MSGSFKRGSVYEIYFPKPRYEPQTVPSHAKYMPKPHTVLEGKHMAIVLHDDGDPSLSKDHALVIPISSAKAAVAQGTLLPTHVPIEQKDHPFLTNDSYALAFQIITIPSHWLQASNYQGDIETNTMRAVTLATLISTGSAAIVQEIAERIGEQRMQEMLAQLKVENASSDE